MAAACLLARVLASGPRCILRCNAIYSAEKWFSKHISSNNRPKQPLTAYIRFFKDQQPTYKERNPDINTLEITKQIARAWRELPACNKQPYEAAAKTDREIYNEQMAKYKAQLTPEQEAALKEEKRRKAAKRRETRKKRQLTVLGKPKRPRTAFNIYMSEHFQDAKGVSIQGKMKHLFEEWQNKTSSQKQTYQQLAEDDKIRYENEMTSWEEHMAEIGREDLVRYKNRRKPSKVKEKRVAKQTSSQKRATALKKSLGRQDALSPTKGKRVKARKSEE